MATKNNPGKFDCHTKADPDEPHFTLLGRDPTAPFVVLFWIQMRTAMGQRGDDPQIREANECATALKEWARKLGKGEKVEKALEAFSELLGP